MGRCRRTGTISSSPTSTVLPVKTKTLIANQLAMSGEESAWWPSRVLAFVQSFFQKPLDPNLPTPPARLAANRPSQKTILKHLTEKKYFAQTAPDSVGDVPLPSFDPGIFDNEMMKMKLYPTLDPRDPSVVREPEGNIVEGTYLGTQVALTQAYSRIEQT
jgi:hypothetical protein